MTFREFCKSLEGRWVKVWTADTVVDEEGNPITYTGRLTVHEDFLEIFDDHYLARFGVPLAQVTGICERSDSEEKVRQQDVLRGMIGPDAGDRES